MQPGKAWLKRIIIAAGFVAIVGVGLHFATEIMEGNDDDDHRGQITEQYVSDLDEDDRGRSDDSHERDMDDDDDEYEEWAIGMAGGAAVGAGLLYWVIRRRKRSSGRAEMIANPMIPSTAEFLDQWEKNQTNTKESN